MRIFRHYNDVPDGSKGAVVALGNFDGVHLGHQALIGEAKRLSQERGVPLGVVAFEPHPQEFFHPSAESFRLTPFRVKARLIAELGADILYAIAFDAEMAAKSARDFVADVLVHGLGVNAIVVGEDFQFGKGRSGTVALLETMGKEANFGVNVSAHQLRRVGFAADVIQTVRAHGLDPRRIVLELTESAWTLEAARSDCFGS